ncbi:hypothetical protein DVK02_02465 [Halobellus sp. Atlit-31R]|nr:hypothetical protein DVK02_02465 [Halobellus sp. Atlit-31R]
MTGRYALDADGSADGQVVLSSDTAVDPQSEVTVTIDAVNDSIDSETITPGPIDATVTDATVVEGGGETNVYAGATVAFVADDGSGDVDQAFDIERETGEFVFAGRTGPGSQAFAIDTDARNWTDGYTVETKLADGSVDRATDVTVRELGLGVVVDDGVSTTATAVEGTIRANASERTVAVELRDEGGEAVDRERLALAGNGETRFDVPASVLAAAGPGNYTVNVTDVGTGAAVSSEPFTVVDDDLRTASVRSTVVEEHAGDVVSLAVNLTYADAATVTIGGADSGFRANATVADGNSDGSVRLWFNTAAAVGTERLPDDGGDVVGAGARPGEGTGTADEVMAAAIDPGDTAPESDSLAAGEYDVTVRAGTEPTAAADDAATLVLDTPEPKRLTNWVAPADADLSTRADVAAAIEAGRLTRASEVAVGDTVVHRLVVPGLAGQFAQRDGTAAEVFFGLAGTAETALYTLNVTQRKAPLNREAYQLELNASAANVVADPANDTYVVSYEFAAAGTGGDTAVGTVADGPETGDPAAGDALGASFEVNENGTFADVAGGQRTVTANYSLVEAAVATAEEPVVVAAAANQSIEGTATVAPGTAVEIRLRPANGTQPAFRETSQAVVEPDGTWAAEFDFGARDVGDTFETVSAVGVVPDADELAVRGEVHGVAPATTTATATATAAARPGAVGGGAGGGGIGSSAERDDDDRDDAAATPTDTATATPTSGSSEGSLVDATRGYLGGLVGTFVDDSEHKSLRERLFEFDVFVALTGLTAVLLFVTRLD